jgi:hypothetical protein
MAPARPSRTGRATANVVMAFKSADITLVREVPTNIATICQLTWICISNDDHPNDAGYSGDRNHYRGKALLTADS